MLCNCKSYSTKTPTRDKYIHGNNYLYVRALCLDIYIITLTCLLYWGVYNDTLKHKASNFRLKLIQAKQNRTTILLWILRLVHKTMDIWCSYNWESIFSGDLENILEIFQAASSMRKARQQPLVNVRQCVQGGQLLR